MKRIKNLLSFTLIIAMVLGMISPLTVNAASKKYYWNYSKYVSYDYVDGKIHGSPNTVKARVHTVSIKKVIRLNV